MFVIETFNLTKDFNGLRAVNNVNLRIEEGEIFGLLGPNGAGKTTLISMLCTILKPSSGTAKVNGFDIVKEKNKVRKSIGIVFQDPSLEDRLTARENLEMHAGLYGVPKAERKKRIEEVLELVGLADRQHDIVKRFSGGMKRRLEIARGLIHYPKVLFLDEPTLGLDPPTRKHIWEYIKTLAEKENITIFLTTHYMEEADFLCNRVAIIDKGEIKVLGPPEELKKSLEGDVVTVEIESEGNFEKMRGLMREFEEVKSFRVLSRKIHVTVKDGEKFAPKLLSFAEKEGMKVSSVSIRRPTLEDVFLHHTGREMRNGELSEREAFRTFVRARKL